MDFAGWACGFADFGSGNEAAAKGVGTPGSPLVLTLENLLLLPVPLLKQGS